MPTNSQTIHWHVDCFENAVLTKKQHGDAAAVLAALRRHPAVSTFEMTGLLQSTLNGLVARGAVREVPAGYPWLRYEVVADERSSGGPTMEMLRHG